MRASHVSFPCDPMRSTSARDASFGVPEQRIISGCAEGPSRGRREEVVMI